MLYPNPRTDPNRRNSYLMDDHSLPVEERRTRARARVRLPVHIMTRGQYFECVTKDLSCEGLYMFSDRLIPHGSVCACTIALPGSGSALPDSVQVECTLEILRVEPAGSDYGIACRIRKYFVIGSQRLGLSAAT